MKFSQKTFLTIVLFLSIIFHLSAQESKSKPENSEIDTLQESRWDLGLTTNYVFSENFKVQPDLFYANVGDASILNVPFFLKIPIGDSNFSIVGGPQTNFFID
ncbi:MAG: hypothetical protein V7767_07000, partial [Leeuwenhoekiella sp.]